MILFWVWSSSAALVTDRPGRVVGMNISVPSFRFGMNSEPRRLIGIQVTANATNARRMVMVFALSTRRITGR